MEDSIYLCGDSPFLAIGRAPNSLTYVRRDHIISFFRTAEGQTVLYLANGKEIYFSGDLTAGLGQVLGAAVRPNDEPVFTAPDRNPGGLRPF
jgi:hypothetical protein